jgi:lipoprotein-releasing system permease protein
LSLVPLVLVQQVAEAMIAGITERFIEVGTYHMQAFRIGDVDLESARRLAETVEEVPGVVYAAPERRGFGLLYSDSGRSGVTVRALSEKVWRSDDVFRNNLTVAAGSLDLADESGLVVGAAVADRLGLSVGDPVRLLTVRPLGGGRFLPRISRFTITGVIDSGYRDLDRTWVFLSLERGAEVLPDQGVQELVGIKIRDPQALPNPLFNRGVRRFSAIENQQEMERTYWAVADRMGIDWRLLDWYQSEQGRYVSFQTTRNLLMLIMVLVLVVASVSIAGSLIMLVLEKEQEIAMLLAIGTERRVIVRAFMIAGFLVGTSGAALGAVVGMLLAVNVNELLAFMEQTFRLFGGSNQLLNAEFYLEHIPIRPEIEPLFVSILTAIALSTIASFIPSRRAGRISPGAILRRHT